MNSSLCPHLKKCSRSSGRPAEQDVCTWAGTRAAVQLVYRGASCGQTSLLQTFRITVSGAPVQPEISEVRLLPSDFPCWEDSDGDENYLTRVPGLFPDLLMPMESDRFRPIPRQYRSLWLCFPIPEDARPGTFDVEIRLEPDREIAMANGQVWHAGPEAQPCTLAFRMRVGKAKLAPQTLIHTEWFHGDCLAEYYQVPPLSEEHWRIMEKFIHAAAQRYGINMLLTPVFTPPLDTAVGSERPTVQLVKITVQGEKYTFDFSLLERWTKLCREAGIEYLEIAHLFTQWGARPRPRLWPRWTERKNGFSAGMFLPTARHTAAFWSSSFPHCAPSWSAWDTTGSMCISISRTSPPKPIWKIIARQSSRCRICWKAAR